MIRRVLKGVWSRFQRRVIDRRNFSRAARVEAHFVRLEGGRGAGERPVLFFNASTRIDRLSMNAAFSLVASWAIRAAGVPVRYAVCRAGLLQCMLGTRADEPKAPPPCAHCITFSDGLLPRQQTLSLTKEAGILERSQAELEGMGLSEMTAWQAEGLPLGMLVLPTLRWALRRHHLPDDGPTRALMRKYLASAASLTHQFDRICAEIEPRALVVFNGITYPEAVARAVARRRDIPVVTHEVGLRPFSAFFSHGDATFREITIPAGFRLSPGQEAELDGYLEQRFKGRFTMAGVRFWPEMESLPAWLLEKMQAHEKMVPVFTNVIFDTSQVHANVIFADMFDWLDTLKGVMRERPDTLFVIRAHPDEDRPGKASRESVADWIREAGILDFPNVAFIAPSQYVSSYELIRRAKLVLVYNSSIGLEASIAGAMVLCAGRARYTQVPSVLFPADRAEYFRMLSNLLDEETVEAPRQFRQNARLFLYRELFHYSLDFSDYLEQDPTMPGFVLLKDSLYARQLTLNGTVLGMLARGILDGEQFSAADTQQAQDDQAVARSQVG